ncbi:hypothetical protein EB796_012327 [Bugula neritina]|uniref:Neurotransmitter-gated ion-channel ligand-binding domain-containing protein n=1 Tax=Bugula neritina TaxID=10212 RepID=A0A7J7JTN2_BUGNE|nr:hypothetical protein EB796_012327 [Bugula neritina]
MSHNTQVWLAQAGRCQCYIIIDVNVIFLDLNVTYTDEVDLIKHLLDHYDNRARPVLNSSHTVQVLFGITPIQISDLDEVNQIFTINVWLSQVSNRRFSISFSIAKNLISFSQ